jgi:capsular polysaccharide biosynthesis protein
MGTERQIALSAGVAARAAKTLREPSRATTLGRGLSVSYAPNTQVLKFSYTAGSPRRAARVANAFVDAYLADRQARTKGVADRMTSALQQQLAPLLAKPKKDDDNSAPGVADQISTLQKRIADIQSRDTSGGDVVREGTPPDRPSGPGLAPLLGLGLLGGLALGLLLAWLRSALEPRARSIAEVEGALGAPVLGILPDTGPGGEPLGPGRTGGGHAETYRMLAFRLRQGGDRTPGGSLLIVAPRQDATAEATAVHLAAAFAECGDDVLLVDATGRTPGLAARLPLVTAGSGDDAGSAGLPEGRVLVDAGTAGRFTLAPGTPGTVTGEVPASPMVTRELSRAGAAQSALVVTRPLLEHTDGLAVAQRVDGVLVLAGLDRTRRDDLRRVRELVGCSGGRVLGAIVGTSTRRGILARRPKVRDVPVAPEMPAQAQPGSSAPDATVAASQG